jgi:hypothetical protein
VAYFIITLQGVSMKKLLAIVSVLIFLISCSKNPAGPDSTVAKPFINPSEGTYSTVQEVSISCATSEAEIRYTLDGTEPTELSPLYTEPFDLVSTATVKAKAYRDKMLPSLTATSYYQYQVSNVFIIPMGGTYTAQQTVQIIAVPPEANIYYTTDGTEPNTSSTLYTNALVINRNTNLRAIGSNEGWTPSPMVSVFFTFQVEQPAFSVAQGTYGSSFSLGISTPTVDAEIRYTTDGTDPTESSELYSTPLNITANTQIKARAYKDGWNASTEILGNYYLRVAAPVFNPAPGAFNSDANVEVTIGCATPEAVIHYTLDGSVPTISSAVYTSPIPIEMNTTVKAMAVRTDWNDSIITSGNYYLNVYAPVFNPPGGQYTGYQTISITSQTPDTEIRYTTNHTQPTPTSTLYTEPLVINTSVTFRARAFKQGFVQSPETSSSYLFSYYVATPYFLPAPDQYAEPISVTIACETVGAEIRYTTDGTDPNYSSPIYTEPIPIDSDTTFRARAYYSNWVPSNVEEGAYTFTP